MAFFLAPLGEIILEGMAAGMATNMGKKNRRIRTR